MMKLRYSLALVALMTLLLTVSACALTSKPTATPAPQATATIVVAATAAPATVPAVAATAVAPAATPPAATAVPTARAASYEKAACPFRLPLGVSEGKDVECGYLVVPEDRADPQTRLIRLAVAIFRNPTKPVKPDPIVYLSGGPGGSALEFAYLAYAQQVEPFFAAQRDIIVFDQRGVGLSKPALDCPAASALDLQLLDPEKDGKVLSPQEQSDLMLQAMLACAKDLSGTAKLSAYNSVANAADVNDLRLALGYDQINLWGISYGTRLALEVMRDYPMGIRSVVLDSVYPPDVDLFAEEPANTMRVFTTLFDGCAADKACNAAYPDLRKTFFDLAAALTKNPAKFTATDPLTSKTYPVLLNGDTLIGTVFQMFYDSSMIPAVPQIIYQAKAGDYSQLAQFIGVLVAQESAMSPGMQYSVQCNEEQPFTSQKDFDAAIAKYPELASYMNDSMKLGFSICTGWGSGKAAAAENQPVSSSIPTLVMAGEYDPVTPPAWAKRAAQTLSKSYYFEYPGMGHGTSIGLDCPTSMMVAFLGDPAQAPASSCMAAMSEPQFYVVGKTEDIKLEPYTDTAMGISGVVPVGWREIGQGTYARYQSPLDEALLFQLSGEGVSSERVALAILPQLGLQKLPEASSTYKSKTLTWTIYRTTATLQGEKLSLAIALADAGGRAYFVMLTANADELDALSKVVLIPVLDAMKTLK
jgi:pimeloyl-ACP methyl ester carboxylesterase